EPDGTMAIVAASGTACDEMPVGTSMDLKSEFTLTEVVRTGRSVRVDDCTPASALIEQRGIRCSVAVPIVVEGSLWGSIAAGTSGEQFPADAEQRMAAFTELAGTAIANAASRAELAASRRRIVAASDETRRRIERDLHDGTQQRLVSLALALRVAEANVPPDTGDLRAELSQIATSLAGAIADLQDLARGIHPAILSQGGLGPALRTLARRSATPVVLDLTSIERLPDPIEVAAYFVASEALANATKHAHASAIDLSLAQRNGTLLLSIRDDGIGGADPRQGSGLVGLHDRVEALGGTIRIDSPSGGGTAVVVNLPLDVDAVGKATGGAAR
ncbi:MAG TPA: GAF domain-containing sensor histidine kinase, partial [Acidimicrobiia bacterium]